MLNSSYLSRAQKRAYTRHVDNLKRTHMIEKGFVKLKRKKITSCRNLLRKCYTTFWKILRTGQVLLQERKKVSDYFSDERIAVYTVIFGDYDVLYEPKIHPDNCDFYLISDSIQPPEGSAWKLLELKTVILEKMQGMNDIQKNRFLKMHPELLFKDYSFSVYLDGNVQLITDPTEFINRMPARGVMLHRHVVRDCVYEEARAILERDKAPAEVMEDLVRFLKENKMPSHYGLLECPVIVRQHQLLSCIELMNEWWKLFERYPYRDQMLLPLVLFQHDISPSELTGLGNNVQYSPYFRKYEHNENKNSK